MELCLVVDHACNLRCDYCYTGSKHSAPMSDEVLSLALDRALSTGDDWLSVSLFGGEPLIDPLILERLEAAFHAACERAGTRPRWRVIIDTNGTRWTPGILDWMERHEEATAIVSLDGTEATHDACRRDVRGRGTYELVTRGLIELAARGIDHQLVAVVTPRTASDLGINLSELLRWKASRIALQLDLRANWSDVELEELRRGTRAAARVWGNAFRLGQKPVVEPLHAKVLSHLTSTRPLPRRCGGGNHEWTVAPSGRIYPCAEMVGEDRLGELAIGDVRRGIQPARRASLQSRSQALLPACQSCDLRFRCARGCACKQRASSGVIGGISRALCESEAAWIDAADEQAARLVSERNAAFLELYYPQGFADPGSVHSTDRKHLPLIHRAEG